MKHPDLSCRSPRGLLEWLAQVGRTIGPRTIRNNEFAPDSSFWTFVHHTGSGEPDLQFPEQQNISGLALAFVLT